MIFEENGLQKLQENIFRSESLQSIMADSKVSEAELEAQSAKVNAMLKDMNGKFTSEQLQDIDRLIQEYGVLLASTVFHNFKLNSFGK